MGLTLEEYRKLQHAAVTGFNGTSEFEILRVTLWFLCGALLLRTSGTAKLTTSKTLPLFEFGVEFTLLILPCIILFLWPESFIQVLGVAVALSSLIRSRLKSAKEADVGKAEVVVGESGAKGQLGYVTSARATIMAMCTLGILAVDFAAFPRRFVKTETFGTSLMDIGVGTVVFSMAATAARQYPANAQKDTMPSLWTAMQSTIPLLVLGVLRMALVKGINYQEHVSEYGVHWNFFVTLGALPLLMNAMYRWVSPKYSLEMGLVVGIVYQMLLSLSGVEQYLLSQERMGWLGMNKEGIISLAGYLSLALLSVDAGQTIFHGRQQKVGRALAKKVALFACFYVVPKTYLGLLPSRRFANFTFVAGSMLFSCLHALGFYLLDKAWPSRPPRILQAISKNQLVFFLTGNVLTGLINVTCYTLLLPNAVALAILVGYMLLLTLMASGLQALDVKIKL